MSLMTIAGHSDTSPARLPLEGILVAERFGPRSTSLTRVAVSFAGLLAHRFGCDVVRVDTGEVDPIASWPPVVGGMGTLSRFLNQGKTAVPGAARLGDRVLLTDDPDVAERHAGAVVLLKGDLNAAGPAQESELTLQAASGLLDIFGSTDRAPLPLPGHQVAYAAGMAAFNALVANAYAQRCGKPAQKATVSAMDVALWVNWKHYMASVRNTEGVGRDRHEEWQVVRCADGFVTFVFQDKDVPHLAKLTGDPFFLGPELASRAGRKLHGAAFLAAFETWARSRKRDDIVAAAQQLRLPIGPVKALDELGSDRQFDARAFLDVCADGSVVPGLPLHWNDAPLRSPARSDEPMPSVRYGAGS